MHRLKQRTSTHQQRLNIRIRGLFDLCDVGNKGYVTREELMQLKNEIALTEEEVNNAFYFLDKDKNGSLSLEEFVSGFDIFLGNAQVSSEKFCHDEISDSSQLFDMIDKDRKGFITKQDLKLVADDFKLSDDEIEEIFLQLYKKGMTVLTFRDFNQGLQSILPSDTESEAVSIEEEVYTNAMEDDLTDSGDVNMDYAEYVQDELKAILKHKATELFRACDKDNKSYITQDDLLELTKELALTKEQVESAFSKLDKDGNKFLTLDEFVDGFGLFLGVEDDLETDPEVLKRQAKSKELFDLCDRGSKGYVTKPDLMRLTNDLGLSIDQVNLIFDELDEDNNGFLTVYEFLQGFSDFLDDSQLENQTHHGDLGPKLIINENEDESDFSGRHISRGPFNREHSMELLDSNAHQVINSVDQYITDSLTKEQLAELWKALRKSDSLTLTKFEEFLVNISNEMKKARQETVHLENTLERKSLSHDLEIQKLYEEMEQQIRNEKSRITEMEIRREKVIKEELEIQLQDKEFQINRILVRQKQLEDKVRDYQQQEQSLRQENLTLSKQNLDLEEQLNLSISSLEDTKSYVSSLQESTSRETQERLRFAMQTSQGIEKEHESLIRQLDMLREMNQKLRDDKDAIEASIKSRADRTTSLDDEIQSAEGKRQLQKTGSIMSSYFSTSKRGRQNSASSSRNKNCLEKQGSVMSSYFEPTWGSQENLTPGEGVVGERRLDSLGEADQPELRRRLIKAIDEDGESMLAGQDVLESRTSSFDQGTESSVASSNEYESSPYLEQKDGSLATSTPLKSRSLPEKPKLRRVLPTRHGGTARRPSPKSSDDEEILSYIRETKIKAESVENERVPKNDNVDEDLDVTDRSTSGDHRRESSENVTLTEDQLSATESEADRIVVSNNNEDIADDIPMRKEVQESKQQLQEMLDDLAKPYTQKTADVNGLDEVDKASPRLDAALSPVQEEEPPQNPNRVYKIVFVGDSGVGKSSLIHRFCFDQFKPNFTATIGVDFQVKIVKVFTEWVALQLWDTAGQERFRSITKQYFRKADGIIVMFDLCSEASFKNVRNWMNSVEDSAEPECTVMILGNKLDLADDGFRKINFEIAARMAKDFDSFYHEVSAKSGDQVQQAMVKMAKKLEEKEDSLMKRSVLNLDVMSEGKKKKCCSR